jgi:hypothetical protein
MIAPFGLFLGSKWLCEGFWGIWRTFTFEGPWVHRAVLGGSAVFSVASLAFWRVPCGLVGSRWTFNFEGPWCHSGCAARQQGGLREHAVHLRAGVGSGLEERPENQFIHDCRCMHLEIAVSFPHKHLEFGEWRLLWIVCSYGCPRLRSGLCFQACSFCLE